MAWLGTWENRRKITISNTNVDAILSNFPVLIKISASSGTGSTDITDIFTELTADGNRKKIAVTTSDGTTECYVEIERFDFANSLAWLWVKVPSVAAVSATELYIYYDVSQSDNTTYIGDTTDAVTHNVWDANFAGVWHMAQDPNGDAANAIKDSTSNQNDGTPAGTMTSADLVDGKVGKAIDFDGTDDYINCGSAASLDDIAIKTIEATINFDTFGEATFGRIAQKANVNADGWQFIIKGDTDRLFFRQDWNNGTSGSWTTDAATLAISTWYNVTLVYDNGDIANDPLMYIGGLSENVTEEVAPAGTCDLDAANDLWFGARSNTGPDREYNGKICEIRISKIARPAAWLKATNYSNEDGLVAFSAAEEVFSGSLDENISVSSAFDTNRCEIDESVNVNSEFLCLVSDSPISDDASVSSEFISEHTGILTEEGSVNAEISVMQRLSGELSEDASVNTEIEVARHLNIADTLSVWDTLKWGWNKAIADSLDITETIEKILGIPVKEWMTFVDTETNTWKGTEQVSDSLFILDIPKAIKVYEDLIADGMAASDAVASVLLLAITEVFTCTDTLLNTGTFQHLIEDGMTLEDIAKRFFQESISDSFAITDTSLLSFLVLLQISDAFAAADTVTGTVTISQTIADSLDALDSVATQLLLQVLIQDGLNIEVTVTLDGELWECWVLNTGAFCPSVYSGYDYNSFAIDKQTNIVYACNEEGIYELTGDKDNGVAFHSGIVLPSTRFGSAENKRFRKAYFGASGNNLLMKMETDNGWRTFRVTDKEMSLTRDLKGRSWSITLQDFDELDSILLQPVLLSKR